MNSFGEDEDGDSPPPAPEPSAEPSETETAGTAYGGSLFLMYLDKARLLILARLHRLVLQKRRKKRPRRRITRLREAIQLGALGALAPAVDTHAEGDRIYARANVERAELTEYYSYQQEISRNPSNKELGSPKGNIEVRIPYDGYKFFTPQAVADVVRATGGRRALRDTEAIMGHLLLTDYGNTDLDATLKLGDRYGAIPISVPISGGKGMANADRLKSDRETWVISYDYIPRAQLNLYAIDVQIEPLDPDNVGSLPLDILTEKDRGKVRGAATRMTRQVAFRPHLWLLITVLLYLPGKPRDHKLSPKVAKMTLSWPTITSLDALDLTVNREDVPIRYNPKDPDNPDTPSIEWSDISMESANDPDDDSEILVYRTAKAILEIRQPGELYQKQSLDGVVEVEVPGYLMSGLDARLYTATGSLSRTARTKLVTKISTSFKLMLDDAFSRRKFSPWQQLYFEEIVPEEARITDIVTALQDRGFDVRSTSPSRESGDIFLIASRREGPDYMNLWILIQPRQYQAERANKVPGGHTYKSVFESGELRVFMRGTLPGESRALTHEMNALQQALRERFARVRARR